MDDKDFDFLFDEKVKENIKNSFDDISFNVELMERIKDEALKDKGFKERIHDFLNYEIEIPVGRIGIVAALITLIPTSFTIYEGNKIIENNIKVDQSTVINKDNN